MKFIYTKEKAGDIIEQLNFGGSLEGGEVIQGEKGDTGEQGIQGVKGATGATGAKGVKGDTGSTGAKGDTGEQGIQGIQGIQGEKGEKGEKGDSGTGGTGGGGGSSGTFLDDGREIKRRLITGTTPRSWESQVVLKDTGLVATTEVLGLEVLVYAGSVAYVAPSSHPDSMNLSYSAILEKNSGNFYLRLNQFGGIVDGNTFTAIVTYLADVGSEL